MLDFLDCVFTVIVALIVVALLLLGVALLWSVPQRNVIEEITGIRVPLRHVIFLSDSQLMQMYGLANVNVLIYEGVE
jgi:hypothetical protein